MAGRISLIVGFAAMADQHRRRHRGRRRRRLLRRLVGAVLMRFVDAMLVLPDDLPAAGARRLHQAQRRRRSRVIIAATSWMEVARVVEGQIRSLRERDFALAAVMLGASRPPHHVPRAAAQRHRRRSSSLRR